MQHRFRMRLYKTLVILLFTGLGLNTFAQPTSGDPIMAEPADKDTVLMLPTLQKTVQSFESIVNQAFTTGNASILAKYFGENVDFSVLGKANVYSKSQAEQVLQHFFTANKPNDFKIIHQGDSTDAQYFIGEMSSVKGAKFRITLNSKTLSGSKTITSLTIEDSH